MARKKVIEISIKNIYVLHIKSGEEDYVKTVIERYGYKILNPRVIRILRRNGKWQEKMQQLFPSYLFIELDKELDNLDYSKIKKVPNVINILGTDKKPIKLSDEEVRYIKFLNNDGRALKPIKDLDLFLHELKEFNCKVVNLDKRQKRVKISLTFLGEQKEIIFSLY